MSKLSNPVSILCIILPPLTAPEADSSPCYKQTNSARALFKLSADVELFSCYPGLERRGWFASNSLSSIGESNLYVENHANPVRVKVVDLSAKR